MIFDTSLINIRMEKRAFASLASLFVLTLLFSPLSPFAEEKAQELAVTLPSGNNSNNSDRSENNKIDTTVAANDNLPSGVIPSIFFTQKEREVIAQAQASYKERIGRGQTADDLLDQLQGIKEAADSDYLQSKYVAQFYLESLIYHKATDWTVWLRITDVSAKFTPDSAEPISVHFAAIDVDDKEKDLSSEKSADSSSPDASKIDEKNLVASPAPTVSPEKIQIVMTSKEQVVFEWTPKSWTKIESIFKPTDSRVRLDYASKKVIFTLTVNQTLTTGDMQIKEGSVPLDMVNPDAVDDGLTPQGAAIPEISAAVDEVIDKAKTDAAVDAENVNNSENNSEKTILDEYKKLEGTKP